MHLYNGRETGWCLTQKLALYDAQGKIIGMAGISHDLQEAGPITRPTNGWRRSTHIRRHYARPIALEELTVLTGLSVAQIERYCSVSSTSPAPDDPQSAVGKGHGTAGRRSADHRHRATVRLHRQRLQPSIQSDDRLYAARFPPDAFRLTLSA